MYLSLKHYSMLNKLINSILRITRTLSPTTQEGDGAKNNKFLKTNLYRWMLSITVAGFLAFPLTGSGEPEKQFTLFEGVEVDRTLVQATEVEAADPDWSVASRPPPCLSTEAWFFSLF
jgi:hypothetical protein